MLLMIIIILFNELTFVSLYNLSNDLDTLHTMLPVEGNYTALRKQLTMPT